eukprot:SAG31_NODE_37289_length_305_cov_1.247573_1_plen_44_part_10
MHELLLAALADHVPISQASALDRRAGQPGGGTPPVISHQQEAGS